MSNFFSRLFCGDDKDLNTILTNFASDDKAMKALEDISLIIFKSAYNVFTKDDIRLNGTFTDDIDVALLTEKATDLVKLFANQELTNQLWTKLQEGAQKAVAEFLQNDDETKAIDCAEIAEAVIEDWLTQVTESF
jgi:hypothetical protein